MRKCWGRIENIGLWAVFFRCYQKAYDSIDRRTLMLYSYGMRIKASQLRADIYNILDSVIVTGEVVEVERGGAIVRITSDRSMSKLSKLKKRKSTSGDISKLYDITWEKEWSGK